MIAIAFCDDNAKKMGGKYIVFSKEDDAPTHEKL